MTKTSSEVKDLIKELENNGFLELRKEHRLRASQIYIHDDYRDQLIKELAPEIDTRIPLPSARPMIAAEQIQGILRNSLRFHVEPGSERKRDEAKADKLELFFAHLWFTNLNYADRLRIATRRYQTVGPFAAWWLEWDAFALPKEEDKREDYRRDYQPFRLLPVDPMTVAFLDDDTGQPTVSTRYLDLPYVEVAKRYGKGDKEPLTILRKQFPYLRGGRGQEVDAGEITTKKARVSIVDDGSSICHYIEIGASDDRHGSYEPITDESPNPWGSNSLILVPGRFNHDAEKMVDRYQGIIVPLLYEQHGVDVTESHAASISLTPSKWGEQLPPEAVMSLISEDKTLPGVEFNGEGWATLRGTMAEVRTSLPVEVKELLQRRREERDAALPPEFLTNPDPATMRNATATAQLAAHETSNRAFDDPRSLELAAIRQVCGMIENFICRDLNKKGQPKEATEGIYVTVSGKEPTKKYMGDRRGEELQVTPDDFDIAPVYEIIPVAETQSQKALAYELAKVQWKDGTKTKSQVIEEITEDVSGQERLLNEEAMFQYMAPQILSMVWLSTLQYVKLHYGMDFSFMALNAGLIQMPSLAPPPADDAIGGQQMNPAPLSQPAIGGI